MIELLSFIWNFWFPIFGLGTLLPLSRHT